MFQLDTGEFHLFTAPDLQQSNESFDSFIISMDKLSISRQIQFLRNFIVNNPNFYQAYQKLLDLYIYYNLPIDELKNFLKFQAKTKRSEKFVNWLLAKISYLEMEISVSCQIYEMQMKPPVPPEMLYDFILAARVNHSLDEIVAILAHKGICNDKLKLARGFYFFESSQNDSAIANLSGISDAFGRWGAFILAKSYINIGNYTAAEKIWRNELERARTAKSWAYVVRFQILAGIQEKQTGSFTRAEAIYDSTLVLAQKIRDIFSVQYLIGLKANIAYITNEYEKAADLYKQAITLAKKCGSFSRLIVWQTSYGKILEQLKQYDQVLDIYDGAVRTAKKFNYPKWLARAKLMKADFFLYLRQHKFARPLYAEVCNISYANNYPDLYHMARGNIADTLALNGEYRSARKIYQQVIDFFQSRNSFLDASYYFWKIGITFMDEKNYSSAARAFQQAFNFAQKSSSKHYELWYLTFLAEAEGKMGKFPAAMKILRQALATALKKNYFVIATNCYQVKGDLFFKKDSLRQAIACYRNAIIRLEEERSRISIEELRIGYFSGVQKTYRKLTSCYLKFFQDTGSTIALDSLFYFDQLSRARTLIDLKLNRGKTQLKQSNDTDYLRYLELCRKLREAQKRIRLLEQNGRNDSKILKDEIGKLHAIRYSLLATRLLYINRLNQQQKIPEKLTISLNDLQRFSGRLSANIIIYHLSESACFALVATVDSISIVAINENSQRISSLVDSLLNPFYRTKSLEIGFTPFNTKIAYSLYKILFEPIEKRVKLKSEVIIVPDLPIINLPLGMLLTKKNDISIFTPLDKPLYKDSFLLKKYSFGYVPCITFLKFPPEFFSQTPQIAIFANPISSKSPDSEDEQIISSNLNWCFHALNFAEREAASIKKVASTAQIFPQELATKKALFQCAESCDILHFATHVFVDNDFNLFSGLVLFPERKSDDDGLLMGYELSDLNFNAKMVVLNGCESGKGELIVGEGTLGLPRLFLIAGCKSVIMSLWTVEDKFAAQFMPEFYANFLNKNTTQTEALRQAQLKMIERKDGGVIYYAHPFFWSSFLCYGQPISVMKTTKNKYFPFIIGAVLLGLLTFTLISGRIQRNKI